MSLRKNNTAQHIVDKHTKALHHGYQVWPSLAFGRPPAMGDARWTADLILATWMQAETGRPPDGGLEHRVGASGGGFDTLVPPPPKRPAPA